MPPQSDVESGVCRANEIHRSTQLTNCPAAPPLTSARAYFTPSPLSLVRNWRRPGGFRAREFPFATRDVFSERDRAFAEAEKCHDRPVDDDDDDTTGVYRSTVIPAPARQFFRRGVIPGRIWKAIDARLVYLHVRYTFRSFAAHRGVKRAKEALLRGNCNAPRERETDKK